MGSIFYNNSVRKIFSILAENTNLKHLLIHSRNTLQWMESVYNEMKKDGVNIEIPDEIKIAALGHDIECSMPDALLRNSYRDYISYRKNSHKKSAEIIMNILLEFGASKDESINAYNAILHHESGSGGIYSKLLCDADALSYCDVLITFEYKRYLSQDDIAKKIKWEYKRMSNHASKFIEQFYYAYIPVLNKIIPKICEETKHEQHVKQ